MMKSLKSSWGYENDDPDFVEKRQECFRFSHGILWNEGNIWKKHLKKWTGRLLQDYDTLKQIMKDPDYDPAFREILLNARLALVLGDHYFPLWMAMRSRTTGSGARETFGQIPFLSGIRKENLRRTSFWRSI